jgi:hypothetical protein
MKTHALEATGIVRCVLLLLLLPPPLLLSLQLPLPLPMVHGDGEVGVVSEQIWGVDKIGGVLQLHITRLSRPELSECDKKSDHTRV